MNSSTVNKGDKFMVGESKPMKFWCESKEYGAKVQERLFELGYKWSYMDKHRVLHPNGRDRYTVYADKEQLLSWGDVCDYEMNDDYPKYHLIETTGEIVPVIQETQEGKSATVATTNNNGTESLDSLFNQIVLLQKENDSLVEQKDRIVNKISAKTRAINILKDKMSEKVGRVGLVLAGVEEVAGDSQVVSSDTVTYYDLKVGDIIKIYDDIREIVAVESSWYSIRVNLEYMRSGAQLWWFDDTDDWKFVSRPNK